MEQLVTGYLRRGGFGAVADAAALHQYAFLVAVAPAGPVPPAIMALYFLKLKRQPLEVPSTYLWRKAMEDLHVNSLWQRLRRSLLLWLQLALVLLLVLALVRPGWQTTQMGGSRFVFLIDNSASMQATDVAPRAWPRPSGGWASSSTR